MNADRTIASLALLKINWDRREEKADFIENFIPFVISLIHKKRYSKFDIHTLCNDFANEFGLLIPFHPMITIVKRMTKQGYLVRNNNNYTPNFVKISRDDFSDVVVAQEQKYARIILKFVEYCRIQHDQIISNEDANTIFIAFIKNHDLEVLFANDDSTSLLPDASSSIAEDYLINSFVKSTFESDQEIFNYIVDISFGHIIANTLLQENFTNFQGVLKANIYLDSGLLFGILGLDGPELQQAYQDFLALIKKTGAKVFIFHHTYDEFLGILESCLQWIDNPNINYQKASRTLLFFKDHNYSSSDIERFINKIQTELDRLEINLIDKPNPNLDQYFQIDVEKLKLQIVNVYKEKFPSFDEDEKDFTIQQDVDSISAVIKLRRGHKPSTISEAKHIFVTNNSTLAYISRQFEISVSGVSYFFIPTVLTDIFIGTLLWIHSPTIIYGINEKRLIAHCYAALSPNRELLKKFIVAIENLHEQGEINDTEVVFLKASRVARNLLQEETLGDTERFSEQTVHDILKEYTATIKREEQEKFNVERTQYQAEIDRLRIDKTNAEKKAVLSEEERDRVSQKNHELASQVDEFVGFYARVLSWIIYGSLAILVVGTGIILILQEVYQFKPWVRVTLIAVSTIFGVIGFVWGVDLKGVRKLLATNFQKWISTRLSFSKK